MTTLIQHTPAALHAANLLELNEHIVATRAYLSGLERARENYLDQIHASYVEAAQPSSETRTLDTSTSQLHPDQDPRAIDRFHDDGNPNQHDAGGEA